MFYLASSWPENLVGVAVLFFLEDMPISVVFSFRGAPGSLTNLFSLHAYKSSCATFSLQVREVGYDIRTVVSLK